MGRGTSSDPAALTRTRSAIGASLHARRPGLEQDALIKVREGSASRPNSEYAVSSRQAVAAALDCALEVLERGKPDVAPVPPALLLQARLSARAGVELGAVVSRYSAGHTLICNAIVAEFADGGHSSLRSLQRFIGEQGALLERVLAAVTEEYGLEAARQRLPEHRQTRIVRALLDGGMVGTDELRYEFDAWHLGFVASGPKAKATLKALAKQLDRIPLLVDCGRHSVWGWFGGQHPIDPGLVQRSALDLWPAEGFLAIGEPAHGLSGWRLTHHQARALAPLAERAERKVLRYAGNAALASLFQDDLLLHSLRQLYLDPLQSDRNGGRDLRQTLNAYFAAGCSTSSAASALGVTRKTVSTRLKRVEKKIGRDLSSCSFEMEAALAVDQISLDA